MISKRLLTLSMLFALLAAPVLAGQLQSNDVFVEPGAYRVARPNPLWKWELQPKEGVDLGLPQAGLEVTIRWLDNKHGMNSRRLARLMQYRIISRADSEGRAFSTLKTRKLAGKDAVTFTVEQTTSAARTHRSEYILVADGKKALLIVIMGGTKQLTEHEKDVKALLNSIAFV